MKLMRAIARPRLANKRSARFVTGISPLSVLMESIVLTESIQSMTTYT